MSISLKAARVNSNLTQAKAAELIGIDPDTLRKWEKGETFPNVPQIMKIEKIYGVGYSDLIFLPYASV